LVNKVFDIIDARCNYEERIVVFYNCLYQLIRKKRNAFPPVTIP